MTNKILASNNKYRHTFAATLPATSMDNLIEIQIRSFNEFIQKNTDPSKRDDSAGLQAVFHSVFPITDYNGRAELHFDSYELLDPQYDVDEYRERALTYHSQLKVKVRMDNYVEEFTNKLILRPPYSDEESEIDESDALDVLTSVLNCSMKEAKSIFKDSKKEPCIFLDNNSSFGDTGILPKISPTSTCLILSIETMPLTSLSTAGRILTSIGYFVSFLSIDVFNFCGADGIANNNTLASFFLIKYSNFVKGKTSK